MIKKEFYIKGYTKTKVFWQEVYRPRNSDDILLVRNEFAPVQIASIIRDWLNTPILVSIVNEPEPLSYYTIINISPLPDNLDKCFLGISYTLPHFRFDGGRLITL